MQPNPVIYSPVGSGFAVILVLLLALAVALLFFDLLASGFRKLGLPWPIAALVLVAAYLGSAVNIPLFKEGVQVPLAGAHLVRVHGILYRVPSYRLSTQN